MARTIGTACESVAVTDSSFYVRLPSTTKSPAEVTSSSSLSTCQTSFNGTKTKGQIVGDGGVRWGTIFIYDRRAVRIAIRTIPSFNLSWVLCQTGVAALCARRSSLTCLIVGLHPVHGKLSKCGEIEFLCQFLCFWLACWPAFDYIACNEAHLHVN